MEHLNWGLPVAIDLFAAGLGAAVYMLAVMAQLAGGRRYRAVTITGALIAPWPVMLGVLLLVVDLGNPLRFWEMILRRGEGFLMFNPTSTMSIGTWLLTIFVILALVYLVVSILAIPFRWGAVLSTIVGIIGLPFALLVTIYTGVLIAATAEPLWNTPLLPVVFVCSAMATGIASVVFILALLQLLNPEAREDSPVPKLERIAGWVLAAQVLAVILFILFGLGSAGMSSMIGSGFGVLFWIGVMGLGLILPIAVIFVMKVRTPQISLVLSALVLLGGFFLRYVILVAGQVS